MCKDCSSNCLTCSSENVCTSCLPNQALKYDGMCVECKRNCLTCQVKEVGGEYANQCTKCAEAYDIAEDTINCKFVGCPDGEYYDYDAKKCVKCMDNCNLCDDASTCTSCAEAWKLKDKVCIFEDCPEGKYYNLDTKTCDLCPTNCTACTSPTFCTKCDFSHFIIDKIIVGNTAQQSCKWVGCTNPFQYLSTDKTSCLDCAEKCLKCSDIDTCTECGSGFF